MNTQLHSAIKATPYEVVFGIKAALEPIPSLRVIDEPSTNDDTDLSDSGEVPEGELRKYMHGYSDTCTLVYLSTSYTRKSHNKN